MKAIVCDKYGTPKDLKLKEIDTPVPKANEVLVKILATAINDYDWSSVRGKPYVYRLLFGLRKPKQPIPGMELSGTIEAVGSQTKSFKIGDGVYGDVSDFGFGTFAEYICINEKALVKKPSSMSFLDATALPHAALLASQSLINIGNIHENQRILINGAGGGVGTLGLQIAKQFNAEVTGVDTGEKLAMMKNLGFEHVIDYKKVDFTTNGMEYDLILDAKTNRSPFNYLKSLSSNGKYITVGGRLRRLLQIVLLKKLISKIYKKEVQVLSLKANEGLEYINDLYEAGNIKPIIDGPYSLADIPNKIQYFGDGKHQGKIVIAVQT